jgi:AcrR family transcriptional regulator
VDFVASPSPIESGSSAVPRYIYDGRLRRGAKRRAAVRVHAVEVASAEGLEGVTIGRLAVDLGISKGHLTELFPSKQAL